MRTVMRKATLTILFILTIVFVLTASAEASEPQRYGILREINLLQSWVIIDSRRLLVTSQTQIRNLPSGGDFLRALKPGQPVLYDTTPQHELLQLWAYPIDIQQRKKLLGEEFIERHP